MDLRSPLRAILPSLDGPALRALAGTTRPLTVFDVHRLAATGSVAGLRKVLERLAAEGVVEVDRRPNASYYTANRQHLAWPAVEILVSLRSAMIAFLKEEVANLPIAPLHASLFGSAARGDGNAESDIDILFIKPVTADRDAERWDEQLDALRAHVRVATGNACQPFDISMERLAEHVRAGDPLVSAWRTDGLHLTGRKLSELLEEARLVVA